jgi:gluconate 2-dehydrogenase gamma chain
MLTEYYPAEDRDGFLAGLDRLEARARRRHGAGFLELGEEEQRELVVELNRLAYEDAPADLVLRPRDPAIHQQHEETGRIADEAQVPAAVDDDDAWDPDDLGGEAFFRRVKELVLVGYYTSEVGATEELRLMPMGIYRADVPYAEFGRAWT